MSARFLLCLLVSAFAASTASANEGMREKRDIFTLYGDLLYAVGQLLGSITGTSGDVMSQIPIAKSLVGANGQPLSLELQPPLGGLGKGVDGIVGKVLGTVINDKSATGATGAPVSTTPASA